MITDKQKIARIAAILATSNLGFMHLLDESRFHLYPERWAESAEHEVCSVAGHFMENSLHEKIFGQEARSWEERITNVGLPVWLEGNLRFNPWAKDIAGVS